MIPTSRSVVRNHHLYHLSGCMFSRLHCPAKLERSLPAGNHRRCCPALENTQNELRLSLPYFGSFYYYYKCYLFIIVLFYWSIVDLQGHVSFRCTAQWHIYTHTDRYIYIYILFQSEKYFYFLSTPHGMWDLSSLTRDWTHTLCSGSATF